MVLVLCPFWDLTLMLCPFMGVKIPTQLLIDLCPLVDVASLALVTYKRTNHKHSVWKTHKKSHLKIASFGCIKSGEKFIKNAKNVPIWRVFEIWSSQTVLPDRLILKWKLVKMPKMRYFESFSSTVQKKSIYCFPTIFPREKEKK